MISKENRKTWHNEKRAKELRRRGYDVGQISTMMQIKTSRIEKMVKHKPNPKELSLDGKL